MHDMPLHDAMRCCLIFSPLHDIIFFSLFSPTLRHRTVAIISYAMLSMPYAADDISLVTRPHERHVVAMLARCRRAAAISCR